MSEQYNFEIRLFIRNSSQTMSLSDFLNEKTKLLDAWTPDWENVTLSLLMNGMEYVTNHWSLGALRNIVGQIKPARLRIEDGLKALIRAGVDDSPLGVFFLFEPNEKNVLISMLYIQEPLFSHMYPHQAGSRIEDLHKYIVEKEEELYNYGQSKEHHFWKVEFPKASLLSAMQHQEVLVQQVQDEGVLF